MHTGTSNPFANLPPNSTSASRSTLPLQYVNCKFDVDSTLANVFILETSHPFRFTRLLPMQLNPNLLLDFPLTLILVISTWLQCLIYNPLSSSISIHPNLLIVSLVVVSSVMNSGFAGLLKSILHLLSSNTLPSFILMTLSFPIIINIRVP